MADQPYYGIDKLYLFPRYQTREQYTELTGAIPPPFDASKPVKKWFDPFPATENPGHKRVFPGGIVVYEQTLKYNGYHPAQDENGKPVLEPIAMTQAEARTLNIPRSDVYEKGAENPERQVPLRQLAENEVLEMGFGGVVTVRDMNVPIVSVGGTGAASGFTEADRGLLQRIAKLLGVL